ncbi:MAG: hypothetical protein RIC35_09885 [Marinoscillum sp.]
MKDLYTEFVTKLKKLFGKFDEQHKRFEKSSNSEISRELGYSDAQFSRLINATATEGEYQRAIQNLDRILKVSHLQQELDKQGKPSQNWRQHQVWFVVSVCLVIALIVVFFLSSKDSATLSGDEPPRDHMLKWTFETSFINPYIKLNDLPQDCNYPCYKYQGKWELKNGYKIPFFRERNGFHYVATEVNMYARCMSEKSDVGDILEGFEYQKHEIWYDKRELPLDSFIVTDNRLQRFYQDLDFSTSRDFVRVATVHTFFRNEFSIDSTLIYRSGQVIGRDLEFVDNDILNEQFPKRNIVQDIENELNRIASNRLEDFSRPINCSPAEVPNLDFHQIQDGSEMSFDCQLTTNRMSFNYNKTFALTNQYIKNYCRTSD